MVRDDPLRTIDASPPFCNGCPSASNRAARGRYGACSPSIGSTEHRLDRGAGRRRDEPMDQRAGALTGSNGRRVAFDPIGFDNDQDAMTYAVTQLRAEVAELDLRFEVEDVELARQDRRFVLDRLDEYVLPRVGRLDAPLLVVIGGSTGAGKSTLTNSLVGVDISPAGFLRPTTRKPVLVHHPSDSASFVSRRILPDLVRTSITGYALDGSDGLAPGAPSIQLVPHEAMPPGLAIIDSPDLDSIATDNRTLARQLFRAADMWIFVTTGTDYADAVPWELLAEAVERRVSVAVVLDRMREGELVPVRKHFATMLSDRGLASAPVFTMPEAPLLDGLLPSQLIAPLQGWLDLQASEAVRSGHIDRAMDGTLNRVLDRVGRLADAAGRQVDADRLLRVDLEALFGRARDTLLTRAADGSALDARVADAWRRLAEQNDSSGGRFRRRVTVALRGNAARYAETSLALERSIGSLIAAQLGEALELIAGHWSNHRFGSQPLFQFGSDAGTRIGETLVDWRQAVLQSLRPGYARHVSGAEDPVVLAVTTLSVGARGAVAAAALRLLETEAGDALQVQEALRGARGDLLRRLAELMNAEAARLSAALDPGDLRGDHAEGLLAAASAVRELMAPT
jgi:energy-coupling factor transporter ATP-binding protein EcfA2